MPKVREVNAAGGGAGAMRYKGTGPEQGRIIEEEQAYACALERCLSGTEQERKEFREMLVGWYYSGNWIEKEE